MHFQKLFLLQLNSSSDYYTSGEHNIIFIKIGSNKIFLLGYTYHTDINTFQNYTINNNLINNYDLRFIWNGTSNEYDLQSVCNGNGFIGIIAELTQVYVAFYDTNAQPCVYTGSGNTDITYNRISLNFQITIYSGIVLNPRAYDNAVFEITYGTDNFAFLQNTIHGGQPVVQFYSSTKACTFHGNCEIPNMYHKTYVDILIAGIFS